MTTYFASANALGGPTHDGSLGDTNYLNGVIARKLIRSGSSAKYITAGFIVNNPSGNRVARLWYLRYGDSPDLNVTISTFATFLKKGERFGYNIHSDRKMSATLKSGGVVEYIEVPVAEGNFSGLGHFGILFDFEGLTDDETYIIGVELDA
jgi:hypothetical protein